MNRPIICAIGVCHRDVELATLWLRWMAFLGTIERREESVLVVYTKRVDPAPLREAVGRQRGIVFVQCPDEQEKGYPGSASHLFLRTLEGAEKLFPGHAVLWCEPDCWPLRPSWLREVAAEYQTCGKPNLGALVGEKFPHQAGNSVYAADWRTRFPSIANVLDAPDYKLWGPGKGQPWDVYCRNETTPQMAHSKLWHHVWKDRDARATRLKDIPATACLFHQDKTGAVIREIAADKYPEFMATLNEGRRFYLLNGHPTRLRAKGVNVRFSYQRYQSGIWRSAVCSTEVSDDNAAALALLVGRFGLTEITETEFCKITGVSGKSLPEGKPVSVRTVEAGNLKPETGNYSHPSVFVMLGRYGDICNILPLLKAEADAGRRPTLVVSKDFADIMDGVSYADRIVWDGAYDQLPEALRWLRRDKGIQAPVVCQVHRNPIDKARLTSSYQSECWRLAGRLDDFASRGPLVFDKRDTGREHDLAEIVFGHQRGCLPVILVGLHSFSSPLPRADEIATELKSRYIGLCTIVDLATVKADRIFDLVGLFEAAELLITADTAFLHLARASRVSTLALINGGWRGSHAEHAKSAIRYDQATLERIVAEVNALIGMKKTGKGASVEGVTGEDIAENMARVKDDLRKSVEIATGTQPRLFHVVHMHGADARHHVAQATWNAAYAEGMIPVHCREYKRDAKTELGDPRDLPFLKDLLWQAIPEDARERGGDIIVWGNSDIGLAAGAVEAIRDHVSKHHAATMRRTESNSRGHPGRDLFAFTVDWLHEHWDEIPDYVIGAPVFDVGIVALVRNFHGLPPLRLKGLDDDLHPAEMTPGFALHQSHDPEWQVPNMDSVPSVRHNKKIFREWAKKHAPAIKFSKGGNLL